MAITATYIDHMGSDLSVVNAARVSFGKKSHCEETRWVDMGDWCGDMPVVNDKDSKLIHYLASGMSSKDLEKWKNQMITANDPDTVMEAYEALAQAQPHLSPFGHCFASFHIKAPIFVVRQLVKHEYLRMNEISRRYVDSEPEFYEPEVWRGRSKDKKQGSSDSTVRNDGWYPDDYKRDKHEDAPSNNWSGEWFPWGDVTMQVGQYKDMIVAGVAPEMARMVLPQSMYTEWYWSGSMDAFANMCLLRLKEDTQYETRLVAQQIDKVMGELYPVSWKALVHG
jgi:thymidylate synthase (FAD)